MNSSTSNNLFPKKILLGLQEGTCNLKCPKCHTHGEEKVSDNERSVGVMDFEKFKTLLDSIVSFSPRVTPQTWDEPLLTPNLINYLAEIKKRNLPITMDTNGLLLNEKMMKDLIELKVDSIFISVDAFYSGTYQKVRGVNQLDNLIVKILAFLKMRGEQDLPRIGVSFVEEDNNREEVGPFVEFWKEKVDVIRVNQKFLSGRKLKNVEERERVKCWSLDDSLMIHHNGEAALCCVDNHYDNKIGNVFIDGVVSVWNNAVFTKFRKLHEEKKWQDTGICNSCDLWLHENPVNTDDGKFITSKTQTHTYINSKEKMKSILVSNRFVTSHE